MVDIYIRIHVHVCVCVCICVSASKYATCKVCLYIAEDWFDPYLSSFLHPILVAVRVLNQTKDHVTPFIYVSDYMPYVTNSQMDL